MKHLNLPEGNSIADEVKIDFHVLRTLVLNWVG
jgi:hypothetical protein